MIKIEDWETYGWRAAIRGMRNPKNSWEKSDSEFNRDAPFYFDEDDVPCLDSRDFVIGPDDLKLMVKLCNAGTDHGKFMRMITVTADITAPLYWWKEYDTYKVGTVANSCSTMHTITDKEFELDDFSHEHLIDSPLVEEKPGKPALLNMQAQEMLVVLVSVLNAARFNYLKTKDKRYWWQLIQLLPSSYNQRRTVQLNYAVLRNMYHARKGHKLDEWRNFCAWMETLPYSRLITWDLT